MVPEFGLPGTEQASDSAILNGKLATLNGSPTPADWKDINLEELGPPLNMDDEPEVATSPVQENGHTYPTHQTDYFQEFRSTPEYLNPNLPHVRRKRVRLTLQSILGKPVLLSHAKFRHNETLLNKPLFLEEVPVNPEWITTLFNDRDDSAERFRPETDAEKNPRWPKRTKELGFIINRLPQEEKDMVAAAYAAGEKVEFNITWGTRWKVTRFGSQTKAYTWPRSYEDDPMEYRGSNFVVFTKVETARNEEGTLEVRERILAEVNLHTKVGNYRINPRGGPYGGIYIDRSLPGLERRAKEGDPHLSEAEYLYNQAADLEEAPLSRSDEQWIRNAFIDFLDSQVDRKGYSVKGSANLNFKLDKAGNVITDGNDKLQVVRFPDTRINVKRGGYLDGVLRRLGEQSHLISRLRKYEEFRDSIYPNFQVAVLTGLEKEKINRESEKSTKPVADPATLMARQLLRTEAMVKTFAPKTEPKNLAYLLHVFNQDPEFDSWEPRGINRSARVLEAMRILNHQRSASTSKTSQELHRPYLSNGYLDKCLDRLEEMAKPGWIPEETYRNIVLPISVGESNRGANHKRVRPTTPTENSDKLFNGKHHPTETPPPSPENRENLIGYDIQPAKVSVEEVRRQLARHGVDIIRTLVAEGDKPAIYGLFMDSKPRQMSDGTELSPAQWINMLRRAFDTERYTNGRSSQHAIESGFRLTAELAKSMAEKDPELAAILDCFDYEARVEATKESKGYSGIAGEVFTRMAINTNLAKVMGIEVLPDTIDYEITYIDRDRVTEKGKLSRIEREKLTEFLNSINGQNLESGEQNQIRPDFIVQLHDIATGELAELWIDSKAYIKKITPIAIQNLYNHYAPILGHNRRLVVAAHSPSDRITKEARTLANELGVIIVGSREIEAALNEVDEKRFKSQDMKSPAEEYSKFKEHPSVYAENKDHRAGIASYEAILDLQHVSGALFATTQQESKENLVYSDN